MAGEAKKAPQAKQPSAAAPVAPRLFMRGQSTFVHSLFGGSTEKMQKNTSYKKFQPELHAVDHTHFFHSHDSQGMAQKHTQPVGGHFHEVTHEGVDDQGYPKVKCGPALRYVDKKLANGSVKRVIEQVKFYDGATEQTIVDSHTHTMQYMGSEELSQAKIAERQSEDKLKIGAALSATNPQEDAQSASGDAAD